MNYWWGFSEKIGWVFLDRTLDCNGSNARKNLIFVDCKSEDIIEIDYGQWDTFATYEKQIFVMFHEEIKEEQLFRLALFKNKQAKYSILARNYHNSILNQAKVQLHNKPCSMQSHASKPSPAVIRNKYGYDITDDQWNDILLYCKEMRDKGYRDQGGFNEYLTQTKQWNKFLHIRAWNDHGYCRKIRGITRSAYKLVCHLMNLSNGVGNQLIGSEKY